jgi:hypothetical protein
LLPFSVAGVAKLVRREGLKIPWGVTPVWVRFPPLALLRAVWPFFRDSASKVELQNASALIRFTTRTHVPFLHLLVSASASENHDYELVVFDLTSEQLNSRFAAPWKQGDAVQHQRVWRVSDVKRVRVISTDETAEFALARLHDRSNQQLDSLADSGVFFPLAPRDSDIVECGTDVTAQHFPPGSIREAAPVPSPRLSPFLKGALLYVALPILVSIVAGVALIYYDRSTTPAPTSTAADGEAVAAPAPSPTSASAAPAPAIGAPDSATTSTDTARMRSDPTRHE